MIKNVLQSQDCVVCSADSLLLIPIQHSWMEMKDEQAKVFKDAKIIANDCNITIIYSISMQMHNYQFYKCDYHFHDSLYNEF